MHRTRSIRFIRREDIGDWRLKVYGTWLQDVLIDGDGDANLERRAPDVAI